MQVFVVMIIALLLDVVWHWPLVWQSRALYIYTKTPKP